MIGHRARLLPLDLVIYLKEQNDPLTLQISYDGQNTTEVQTIKEQEYKVFGANKEVEIAKIITEVQIIEEQKRETVLGRT